MKSNGMVAYCLRNGSWKFLMCFLSITLVSAIAACAGLKGTGRYEPLPYGEKKKVLEELKKSWQDYNVYCDGAASSPAAVIFDPKNDDRNLVGYRYIRLSKEDGVRLAIVQIEFQLDYTPLLYKIFDDEKNFYGYVFMARDLPVSKRVNEKTLELPSFESTFHVP